MKKIFFIFASFFIVNFLNACSVSSGVPMDELSEEGRFQYKNKDLGFEISLPDTFEFYQVQRKNTDEYSEIEFFVPTSDMAYPQEVQSYAKPLMLRFYKNETWEKFDKREYVESVFFQLPSDKTGKFFIKFWKTRPKDWEGKWNQEIEEEIKISFKVL